jgi:hypothetical protein
MPSLPSAVGWELFFKVESAVSRTLSINSLQVVTSFSSMYQSMEVWSCPLMLPLSELQQKQGIFSLRKYMLVQKGKVYHHHKFFQVFLISDPFCKAIKSGFPFLLQSLGNRYDSSEDQFACYSCEANHSKMYILCCCSICGHPSTVQRKASPPILGGISLNLSTKMI